MIQQCPDIFSESLKFSFCDDGGRAKVEEYAVSTQFPIPVVNSDRLCRKASFDLQTKFTFVFLVQIHVKART